MPKTIKARYRNGLIEPLEKIDLADGTEITITVSDVRGGKAKSLPLCGRQLEGYCG